MRSRQLPAPPQFRSSRGGSNSSSTKLEKRLQLSHEGVALWTERQLDRSDPCCIDKSSSAELTEAINSMYCWYKEATMCYVYLDDVLTGSDVDVENSPFAKARWFQR
jgi:hypothetical protein